MASNYAFLVKDSSKRRACFCGLFPTILFSIVFIMGGAYIIRGKHALEEDVYASVENDRDLIKAEETTKGNSCQNTCRHSGSESLPIGIVANISNLDRRPLWGYPPKKGMNSSNSLLAMPVGIRQKHVVDKIVRKFLLSEFVVMLFHYDGIVDEWKDLEWSDRAIHISAVNQTKWWFAKRFLHPDIVAEYSYIFIWDEDIGVQNFNPIRYLSVVQSEVLEISQPALDPEKSKVHHPITARSRGSKVHRRTYNAGFNGTRCNEHSKGPPCTGWIELMAPVFSRRAWRCVWYLIQNDLIHAWGLDMQLGYCAQGNRTRNIGVVDAEYIVHYGFPTLGAQKDKTRNIGQDIDKSRTIKNLTGIIANVTNASSTHLLNIRIEVRRESYREYKIFKRRWNRAIKQDKCWKDPYLGQDHDISS